jgi:WD40 repeat protein
MSTAVLEETADGVSAAENPFPGLRPFRTDESQLFFGRDGQSEKLLDIFDRTRFLAVVGTSGSGKSSLVRAGLMPALAGGITQAGSNWRVAVMRPGHDPIGNLARALNESGVFGPEGEDDEQSAAMRAVITVSTLKRGSRGLVEATRQVGSLAGDNLLIVVDQFEELFRFAQDLAGYGYEDEAAAFVKLLLKATKQEDIPIYAVITMRSDFLGDCARFWELPEAINDGQYLIPRMNRGERAEAITGPLGVFGASIAPDLINRLVNETEDKPDQLPLLQHALMRTWDRARADVEACRPLDLSHYEAVGTMAKALSNHADEAYGELPDERSRQIAEKLFKSLTEKEAGGRKVRRPTRLRDICDVAHATQQEVVAVTDVFRREGRSFLMPPSNEGALRPNSVIDISHESLIEGWERLDRWVEEEAQSASVYRRLGEQAELHKEGKAGLFDELDVKLAVDWREQREPDAAWAKRYHYDFAEAMKFLRKCERNVAKQITRLRILASVLSALLLASLVLLAGVVGLSYLGQVYKRKAYNHVVSSALDESGKNFPKANSLLGTITDEDSKGLRNFEWNYLWWLGHNELATLTQQPYDVPSVFFSAEGRRLAAADMGGNIVSWDMSNPKRPQTTLTLKGHTAPIYAAAFSPDGRRVATGHADGELLLWDERGQEVGRLSRFSDLGGAAWLKGISSIAFSPDGASLAACYADGVAQFWDVGSQQAKWYVESCGNGDFCKHDGRAERPAAGLSQPVRTVVAFSPDGSHVATGHARNVTMLWHSDGQRVDKLMGEFREQLSAFLRERPRPLSGERGAGGASGLRNIFSIAFSPKGTMLAVGRGDGGVSVWHIRPRNPDAHRMLGAGARVRGSGAVEAAGGQPAAARDTGDGRESNDAELERRAQGTHTSAVSAVLFLDEDTLASGSPDGTIKVWNLKGERGNEFVASKKGHSGGVLSIVYSPETKLLATGSDDRTVKLWTLEDGNKPPILPESNSFRLVALSAGSGNLLAAVDKASNVILWDTNIWKSRKTIPTLHTGEAPPENRPAVVSVALSPDGALLATGSEDGSVKLWDTDSGQLVKPLAQPTLGVHLPKVVSLAFSWPDGATLATASSDGTVGLWNTRNPEQPPTLRNFSKSGGKQTEHTYSVAFSPGGTTLAVGDEQGEVTLWDADLSRMRHTLANAKAVTSLAFSADGRTLVAGSRDGTVKIWVTNTTWTEAFIKALPNMLLRAGGIDDVQSEPLILKTHPSAVISVAFNSKVLAIVTAGGSVDLFHAAEDTTIKRQQVPDRSDY